MTPKHHALLSSIAAIKDAAFDEYQFLMRRLDEVENGRVMVAEVLSAIRDGITRLSHSVISAHDTAAVLAEPMHMAEVPAPVAEPAPVVEEATAEIVPAAEAEKPVRKSGAQVVRDVPTRDVPPAADNPAMSRNGGKAEA